ncbi:natural resistance-associated macrophage protein [Acrasis kona]|uniref:Natural resistance-associated macrophage protein n=1 Tax=Acrasis kona TaxID=1008807 RepID=A0AAW2YQB2_9EUKA
MNYQFTHTEQGATDIQGGSNYGYSLIWVQVVSNVLAIILQTLAARMGLVTGKSLAQVCQKIFNKDLFIFIFCFLFSNCAMFYPKPISFMLWVMAELAIASTDLAEVLGTAIGLKLLFNLPMIWGVVLTAFDTLLLLVFQNCGHRFMETLIFIFMAGICGCFVVETFFAKPDPVGILRGLVPTLHPGSLSTATGILGATIMPHNIYLHSGLMVSRRSKSKVITQRRCLFAVIELLFSLNIALFVNAAILVVAAATFYGKIEVSDIRLAAILLESHFGKAASIVFGVALLLAGQSSTITGTIAGEIVMDGFLNIRLPSYLRRMLTRGVAIIPAVIIILSVGEATTTSMLVWSQVVLSIQLPFAIIPLIRITSNDIMGEFKNRIFFKVSGWVCVVLVVALNVWMVFDTMTDNLQQSPWWLWVIVIFFAILFVIFTGYVTFCKIEERKEIKQITYINTDSGIPGTKIILPTEAGPSEETKNEHSSLLPGYSLNN